MIQPGSFTPGDPVRDWEVLQTEGAIMCATQDDKRDVLAVSGADATSYLNGQMSQDMEALSPGEHSWSFVLDPKGKLESYCRVFRNSEENFFLEVPHGCGEALRARLARFLIRVKCELNLETWDICTLLGSSVPTVQELLAAERPTTGPPTTGPPTTGPPTEPHVICIATSFPDVTGYDLLAPDLIHIYNSPRMKNIHRCSLDVLEAFRIEAGQPVFGKDLQPGDVPASAGEYVLQQATSFTKGCYVGQELVERMASRGTNAPRRLLGAVLRPHVETSTQEFDPKPEFTQPPAQQDFSSQEFQSQKFLPQKFLQDVVGARLLAPAPGSSVSGSSPANLGTITSAAFSPRLNCYVALAQVNRSITPTCTLQATTDTAPVFEAEIEAEIHELPLNTTPK